MGHYELFGMLMVQPGIGLCQTGLRY